MKKVEITITHDVLSRDKNLSPMELALMVQSQVLAGMTQEAEITSATRTFMGLAQVTYIVKTTAELEEISSGDDVQPDATTA